jgi:hypothetical protein
VRSDKGVFEGIVCQDGKKKEKYQAETRLEAEITVEKKIPVVLSQKWE